VSTCKANTNRDDCRGKRERLHGRVSAVPLWTRLLLLPFFLVTFLAHADDMRLARNTAGSWDTASERLDVRSAASLRYDLPTLTLAELEAPRRRADLHAGTMAVIYPDIGEPYRSIFAKMIEGIEDSAKSVVRSYPIAPGADPGDLNAQLKRSGVKVVIALGRQGLKIASTLDRDMPVVVGGVLTAPDNDNRNLTSISLTPDPALLFARLKSMLSGVKRVIVVYDPRYNDWLIKLARDAARAQGLELVAYEAHDLAAAARLYESAFAASDGRRDAIWLPQDATTVDEATILPLVLKESWNRGVPVFSSSFLHVKKGALFALYPNNMGLGRTLATTADAIMSGDCHKRSMLPLRDVYTAVNLRTASHIGLSIGYQQQRDFEFIFPEP
jgi:putative tryptophan/tyrosine transport system substrate-binding protein